MTTTQLLLLGLAVLAAIVAGYFIGRWSAEREQRARAARPSPLPEIPDALPDSDEADAAAANARAGRARGAPPPASAGETVGGEAAAPAQRRRGTPPPASANTGDTSRPDQSPEPQGRVRRGPPPPAAAGLAGDGDTKRR